MNTAYETQQFEVAATEIGEQESPTKLDQLLEEIGGRYISALQALSKEFSRFYESQLTLKDERIAELQQRLEAAEHDRDAREAQMRELRHASARYAADLRALSHRLSQHMNLAEADHQVIEEDRDSP